MIVRERAVFRGIDELLAWYERFGRSHLPWRRTRDPYRIVVAECMLQQTQVERVLPAYAAFLKRFPTLEALAASDAGDVIRAWRGLGYNSRAQRLRQLAQTVVARHAGVMPRDASELLALPGIGPYTAAAVRAFAFDRADAALDTNIRRIVQRVAFGLDDPEPAPDRELDRVAAASIPPDRGHDWNSALMDLGSTICTARAPKCLVCPLCGVCAAAPVDPARLASRVASRARRSGQAGLAFERTTRFLRGRIIDRLRDLPSGESLEIGSLCSELHTTVPPDRLDEIPGVVDALVREGILSSNARGIALNSQ